VLLSELRSAPRNAYRHTADKGTKATNKSFGVAKKDFPVCNGTARNPTATINIATAKAQNKSDMGAPISSKKLIICIVTDVSRLYMTGVSILIYRYTFLVREWFHKIKKIIELS
jgi:hypothetical protein